EPTGRTAGERSRRMTFAPWPGCGEVAGVVTEVCDGGGRDGPGVLGLAHVGLGDLGEAARSVRVEVKRPGQLLDDELAGDDRRDRGDRLGKCGSFDGELARRAEC